VFRRDDDAGESAFDTDPASAAVHYERLLQSPGVLRQRYTRQQIDSGFGAMLDCSVPMNVPDLVWDGDVPLESRKRVIRAMASLYRDLFDEDALFGTPFMWWDPITYDFECGNRHRDDGDEVRQVQDCMFETLTEILNLPSSESQRAALHGLGHLHHPKTTEAIDAYLAARPTVTPELRQYARQSALGLIQ